MKKKALFERGCLFGWTKDIMDNEILVVYICFWIAGIFYFYLYVVEVILYILTKNETIYVALCRMSNISECYLFFLITFAYFRTAVSLLNDKNKLLRKRCSA